MTDKEKIRKEVERLRNLHQMKYQQLDADSSMSLVECGKRNLCNELLSFIDSLQEEPVSDKLGGINNALNQDRAMWNKEEPVSDNLDDAAFDYAESCKYDGVEKLLCVEHFKAGAEWKERQFEKNRLKHCNSITNEQAELEQGFIDQHLDKYQRMPTFLDAIEYGMRLQKQKTMTSIM